jgi:HEAT repeat protein
LQPEVHVRIDPRSPITILCAVAPIVALVVAWVSDVHQEERIERERWPAIAEACRWERLDRHDRPAIEAALPHIIEGLQSCYLEVRHIAVRALGWSGVTSPEVREALSACLASDDVPFRLSAIEAFRELGCEREAAVTAAVDIMRNDPEPQHRACAAFVLGEFGKRAAAAIPALQVASEEPDAQVRRCASLALEAIRVGWLYNPGRFGVQLVRDPVDRLANGSVRERVEALMWLRAIAAEGAPGAAWNELMRDLQTHMDVSEETVSAAVTSALAHADVDVRRSALRFVAHVGADARVPSATLRACMKDLDPEVRIHAVWAVYLIEHEGHDTLGTLVGILRTEPSAAVRHHAVNVISQMGADARAAIPALRAALTDRDPEVCREVEMALLKVDVAPK